jgi:hypothetical protein
MANSQRHRYFKRRKADIQMSSKKKVIAIVITTAALTIGTVGFANASTKSLTKISTVRTNTRVAATTNPAGAMMGGQSAQVASVLSALVGKGAITQAQADAITAAITAAQTAQRANNGAPMGRPMRALNTQAAATQKLISDTIGVDTATIKSRMLAGDSLATIAGAKKDALIAALVAQETTQIDAAITAGKLTAAQATAMKANLTAGVTAMVNATRGAGFSGAPKGAKGGRGHGGMMGGSRGGAMGAPAIPSPAATA